MRHHRQILVVILAACLSVPAEGAEKTQRDPDRKPNVLFIAVDDLRPELGCYGAVHVHSPRLDAFAKSGVTFLNAHCQVAVCNPSRASLLTGRYPDTIRVWDLRAHFRDLNPDIVTIPQHFKQHGYTSVAFGKIFHNPLPDRRSWSEPNHWPKGSKGYSKESKQQHEAVRARMVEKGRKQDAIARVRPPATEIIDTADDNEVLDGAIAKAAIERIGDLAAHQEPFFLAVGFIRPHLAFMAPKKYWDLYDREDIPLVPDQATPADAPAYAMNTMYELRDYCDLLGTPTPLEDSLSEAQQRRLKHGYLACVSFIDAQVGRLLDELDRLGIADNTIVVLWGDHGWKLGEHRSWCKQTNYDIDTRAPLLIRAPRLRAGRRLDLPVEFVDIYPTLCELAGLPPARGLEGQSLVPLLAGEEGVSHRPAFSQFRREVGGRRVMGYAMRTEFYRLVEWREWTTGKILATELYDHSNDSGEQFNVAARPANKGVVEELRERLRKRFPVRKNPVIPGVQSLPGRTPANLRIVNKLAQPLHLWWIDPRGSRQKRPDIPPGKTANLTSWAGHVFAVESEDGSFHGLAYPSAPAATFVVK